MSKISLDYFQLPDIIKQFNCKIFVETGCDKGDSLATAIEWGLYPAFSCDINYSHVEICRKNPRTSAAIISCMDSASFLQKLLPTLSSGTNAQVGAPTLFWLDAHNSQFWGVDSTKDQEWPLYKELLVIKELKSGYENDVIVCDDFKSYTEWSERDVRPWQDFLKIFEDTHTPRIIAEDTGGLVLTPKREIDPMREIDPKREIDPMKEID